MVRIVHTYIAATLPHIAPHCPIHGHPHCKTHCQNKGKSMVLAMRAYLAIMLEFVANVGYNQSKGGFVKNHALLQYLWSR